jgi:tetratricopeptide (TPR) repeat protein
MLDAFTPTDTLILVRFHKWDEVLKQPEPDKAIRYTNLIWHFAQGMAHTATGKLDKAENELLTIREIIKNTPADASLGLNDTVNVMRVAENFLAAKLAMAKKDNKSAVEFFRKGVAAEDRLNYTEPADWYIPVRESLGAALMMNKEFAEAETVFREDLQKNPRNGRSLFGLLQSLKAQNKTIAAQFVQREFETAWKNADTKLRIEDL